MPALLERGEVDAELVNVTCQTCGVDAHDAPIGSGDPAEGDQALEERSPEPPA